MMSSITEDHDNTTNIVQPLDIFKIDIMLKASLESVTILSLVVSMFLNILNCAVFIKMGLVDVMNLCLFTLSVFDALSSFLGSIAALSNRLGGSALADEARRYMDIDNLWDYMLLTLMVAQTISTNVTSLVAVERCLCVVTPFKVKQIVTLFRTRVIIVVFIIFGVAMNIPNFLTATIQRVFNPSLNVTRLEIVYLAGRYDAVIFVNTFTFLIFDPISIILVVVTSIIMIRGLHRSAKFRGAMAGGSSTKGSSNVSGTKSSAGGSGSNNIEDGKTQLTANNVRLVKMLLIVSAATAVIHVMSVAVGISALIEPEFVSIGKLEEPFILTATIFQFCYACNMGMNTFVYFHYNTKFRNALTNLMPCLFCEDKVYTDKE